MPQRCLGTISGLVQGTTASKKNYQISIFWSFQWLIGAEIWTRRMPRNTKSPWACSGAKNPAGVGGDTFRRPKNSIRGGSEQFGASWGRFLARGRNSLGQIFKVEKCRENEKIDFATRIESRCEVRDMGPGGRKACPAVPENDFWPPTKHHHL